MNSNYISIRNLNKVYEISEIKSVALHDINLDISKGELLVVLGSSGSGKSTLLNIIGGLDSPTSGEITVGGRHLERMNEKQLTVYRRDNISFIFQFYNLIQDLTAYENVDLSAGISEKAMSTADALASVGLANKKNRYPSQLSGGEQQRVAISRAIVKKSDLLLCDEPTGALDLKGGTEVLSILENLCREQGKTVIIVTHSLPISEIADRVIKLKGGEIVDDIRNENPISAREVEW